MSKKFPMSFSKLAAFEQCPRKFAEIYIEKRPQPPSEQMTVGLRTHESIELYGRSSGEIPLLPEVMKHKEVVDRCLKPSGDKYFEHKMAIGFDREPCGWDDHDVMLRGIADLAIIEGRYGYCIDWKTGKVKADPTQLTIFATLMFAHFPEIEWVRTALIFLNYDDLVCYNYNRNTHDLHWAGLEARLNRVYDAIDLGVFETHPSGLCPWCPIFDYCDDAYEIRKRRKRKS